MIKKRVREICESKGIQTAYQLQVAAGLSPTVAASLFNETFTRISMNTCNKICTALECQISDLIVYAPDDAELERPTKKRAGKNT